MAPVKLIFSELRKPIVLQCFVSHHVMETSWSPYMMFQHIVVSLCRVLLDPEPNQFEVLWYFGSCDQNTKVSLHDCPKHRGLPFLVFVWSWDKAIWGSMIFWTMASFRNITKCSKWVGSTWAKNMKVVTQKRKTNLDIMLQLIFPAFMWCHLLMWWWVGVVLLDLPYLHRGLPS